MENKKRFLFLGASTDDCEWMAGGTARLLVREGHHVAFAGMSVQPERMALYKALTDEAWGIVGVAEKIIMQRTIAELNDRELMETIGEVIDRTKPDICMIQPPDDYMAHHVRFARACFQALQHDLRGPSGRSGSPYRVPEVYAMECPSAPYTRVDYYVNVDDTLEDALRALRVYNKWGPGFGDGMARTKQGLAMLRGALPVSMKCDYAEGFKLVRACESSISSLPLLLGSRFSAFPIVGSFGPSTFCI